SPISCATARLLRNSTAPGSRRPPCSGTWPGAARGSTRAERVGAPNNGGVRMNLQEATEAVKAKVGTDSGLGATVKFELEDGVIYVDAKTVPNVVSNEDKDADCTIRVTLENFSKMLQGDLDSTLAYMTGRLKVEGNMGVAMELSSVL